MPAPAVPTALRVASALMGLVFFVFAALQLNDPDPEVWATLYGSAALLSLAAASGRRLTLLSAFLCVGTLAWSLTLLPQVRHVTLPEIFGSFTMKTAAIEESREGLGLLIVSVWMAVLWLGRSRRR